MTQAEHQLIKVLDTKGLIYLEGNNWTEKHRTWLNRLKFDNLYGQLAPIQRG